jgi:predicted transcriptional regulator
MLSFKPDKKGLQQVLGELESEIMEILWEKRDGITGRQIYENLKQKKRLAYTTVLTVIDRLVNKGLIIKRKNQDNTYIYFCAKTKEEFKEEISKAVVTGLMKFAGRGAVTAFVHALESTNPERIVELEKLLKEKQRSANRAVEMEK